MLGWEKNWTAFFSMSHSNTLSNDSHYNMHSDGSAYPHSVPGPRQRIGPGTEGDECKLHVCSSEVQANTVHSCCNPTELFNPSFVSSGYTSPPVQSQQQCLNQEWYQGGQTQGDNGNHSFTTRNTALSSGASVEAYNNGHRPHFGGDQNMPKVPSKGRVGGSSINSCISGRIQSGIVNDDQGRDSHPQSENMSLSSSTEKRPSGRPINSAIPNQASGERLHPRWRKIGIVYSNDEMKEFRYFCHVDGCSNTSCGRPQELKRHWDSFHENSIIWCPIRGCERSKAIGTNPFPEARKDKLKDHARNIHDIDLEF